MSCKLFVPLALVPVVAFVLVLSGGMVDSRSADGAGAHVSAPKKLIQPTSRVMYYYVSRNIDIKATQNSFLQRIKRQVTGSGDDEKPDVSALTITSKISSKFSTTVIRSSIHNPYADDKQATFNILLPETAFMSKFTMIIDDETYDAEVKSKEEAEEEYKEAQDQNKTAGMVGSDNQPDDMVRGMERFKVSVNVAGESTIHFTLTYLELLQRRLGKYEQKISVRPNQVVQDLNVNVFIYEPEGVTFLDVIEPFSTNSVDLQDTEIVDMSPNIKEIYFTPDVNAQREMGQDGEGLNGDLTVRYDVQHGNEAGVILVENDYFVHYFAPPSANYQPLKKNVIFVIDISGSMGGTKIEKTRESMLVILDQLRESDKFMLLLFDDEREYWPRNKQLASATSGNINSAKGYVKEKVRADGGTNINGALVDAGQRLVSYEGANFGANMIVFLTDGEPTVGETNTKNILSNVHRATNGKVSIFSLGFGFNLNFELLKAISFQNHGFVRRIYDEGDANTQLENFFNEINSPLLYDIKMEYPADLISAVTQTGFAQYFQGSEIVVAGKFKDQSPVEWDVNVVAIGQSPVELSKHIVSSDTIQVPADAAEIFTPGFIERLFAYMEIKNQLRKELMTDDEDEKERIRQVALQLALDYQLVTPLTSFIIVQNDRPEYGVDDERAYYDMGGVAHSPTRTFNPVVNLSSAADAALPLANRIASVLTCFTILFL